MRENLARFAAVLFGILAVLGAVTFATRLNPRPSEPDAPLESASTPEAAPAIPPESVDPDQVARGRALFVEADCTRCHAAEGAGNPRLPLDGVGARRTRAELRAWIVAGPSVRADLGRSVVRTKEGYAALPPADLDALSTYLSTLR